MTFQVDIQLLNVVYKCGLQTQKLASLDSWKNTLLLSETDQVPHKYIISELQYMHLLVHDNNLPSEYI